MKSIAVVSIQGYSIRPRDMQYSTSDISFLRRPTKRNRRSSRHRYLGLTAFLYSTAAAGLIAGTEAYVVDPPEGLVLLHRPAEAPIALIKGMSAKKLNWCMILCFCCGT